MPANKRHTSSPALYRKLGRFLSLKLFMKTRLTPNAVTGLGFLLVLISAWFFSIGLYWYTILGLLLFQLSQILDFSDGELARAKNMVSKHGDWLDRVRDFATYPIILFGITFGIYRMSIFPTGIVWFFGVLAIASIQFRTFLTNVNTLCFPISSKKKVREELGSLYGFIEYTWTIVLFSIIPFAIFNMLFIYIIIYAIYNLLYCSAKFVYLNSKYGKLHGIKRLKK